MEHRKWLPVSRRVRLGNGNTALAGALSGEAELYAAGRPIQGGR